VLFTNPYFSILHKEDVMKPFFRIQVYFYLGLIAIILLTLTSCTPLSITQPDPTQKAEPTEQKAEPPEPVLLSGGVQEIAGVVIGGGDTTPEGLMDAPRIILYQVRLESGEEINLTYTAYPPSPANENQPGPKLTFQSGTINIGDQITARGTYDPSTQTLTVALETDFINTHSTNTDGRYP
jgi:hypothetical protein